MDFDLIKVIISVMIVVIGWITGHILTNKINRKQKRRDISTEHLINAYRVLTNDISHRDENAERSLKLENILSDIQLFGSKTQVDLAKKLVNDVATGGSFQLDPLINDLRDDLRNQLGLSKLEGNITWLRFKEKNNK